MFVAIRFTSTETGTTTCNRLFDVVDQLVMTACNGVSGAVRTLAAARMLTLVGHTTGALTTVWQASLSGGQDGEVIAVAWETDGFLVVDRSASLPCR